MHEDKIYSKIVNENKEIESVISSVVERCPKDEVDWGIRSNWEIAVSQALEQAAPINPYLQNLQVGEEVHALEAVAWVKGSQNVDCRPKLFDKLTKTWKLLDTGSAVTVVKKGPEDKIDESRSLKAVNGTVIKSYGQRVINIQLGRKSYPVLATVADIGQDIIGWDFIVQHKLSFDWTELGDLYIVDKKADIRQPLKFVTVPTDLQQNAGVHKFSELFRRPSSGAEAFEVASMKTIDKADKEPVEEVPGEVQNLINMYPNLLEPSFNDLSTKHGVTHKINTGSATPTKCKVRPLMANSEKAIKGKEAWDQMERLGVVERVDPNAKTEWGSPLHLVPKPNNGIRPCSDFRQLNSKTVPDSYPISSLKSFTKNLRGSKVFSKIDLFSAFHNVVIDTSDVPKTTTLTPWGVFVYKRLAFGLAGAPSTFSKLIDSVLAGVEGIYTYLDDILVHSPDMDSHLKILNEVFRRLQESGLAIKIEKCKFLKSEVDYLGYNVSEHGIKPLKRKVDSIVNFEAPKSQKDLLHFLGALNYFRTSLRGIKSEESYRNPAEILQVLFNLGTCKLPPKTKLVDIWNQSPKVIQAFKDAKQMLLNAVTLTHPDPGARMVLCTDASDYAIGGSLCQVDKEGKFHPLGFFSRHLGPDKQAWSTYRKELYACVQSLRHFLPEFYGNHITIFSDHLPLTKSFESNTLQSNDPVAQRQLIEIGMFTKEVKYLKGSQNLIADWLSRKTPEALIGEAYKLEKEEAKVNRVKEEEIDFGKMKKISAAMEVLEIDTISTKAIAEEQRKCRDVDNCRKGLHPKSLKFRDELINGTEIFCEVSGSKIRPVLPEPFRLTILQSYHNVDHPGQRESQRRCASQYYWPVMKKEIKNYVRSCHACQSTKPSKLKEPQPGFFPVPQKRFSHIHIDVCGPLPPSRGYKYLLMVVDRTTRYVDAIPMIEASTNACADALLHSWVSRHGLSRHCTSDNGVEFVSAIWKRMQDKLGIKLHYTPLYSPQANGLCERQNSTIKTSLKAALIEMGEKHKNDWYDFLPWILLMKRTSYQKELDASPSMLVYGSNPAIPGDCLINPGEEMSGPDLKELAKNLTKLDQAQPKQTSSSTNNPVEEPPKSVTHVYIKEHGVKGLEAQFRGPFPVISRPSRSTVKVRVGFFANGEERHQIRHWRDLKIAQRRSEDTPEASRPKLGRPKNSPSVTSEAANLTEKEDALGKNKTELPAKIQPAELPAKIQTNRPVRSTRNPAPSYVDSVVPVWSASSEEIAFINQSINARHSESG